MYINCSETCRKCGDGVGDSSVAGRRSRSRSRWLPKSGGDHFDFLVMEELSHKVHPRSARLAGAETLLRQAVSDNADGNGGAMGAGMRMMTVRLCMGQIQRVSRDLRAYTGVQVGADAVAATAIPGLLQAV
jgi:hypothetical protein